VSAEKDETEEKDAAETEGGGAVAGAQAQAAGFQAGIEAVRARTDVAAKAVASLGTAGISAIGVAKFADVFPYHGPGWALAAVIAGFFAMGVAVAVLTARLWRTQQPIVVGSDIARMVDTREVRDFSVLDKLRNWLGRKIGRPTQAIRSERELVEDVYDDMTVLNDVDSLRAYEARGRRLGRVARRVEPDAGKKLLAEADQIRAEVMAVQIRAAHAVIRRRAGKAVRGLWTIVAFLVFLLGLAGVALGADSLEAKRTEQDIGFFKSCAEAHTTGVVEAALPDDCPDVEVPPEAPTDQPQQSQETP
jgi:hypothetical protein